MKTTFSLLRVSILLAAIVAGLGTAGCTQVQVGNAQGKYKLGELQVFADKDFKRVYEAAKGAIKEVGLFQTQDDRKVVEADLHARDSADTLVVVKIKEIGPNRTSVKIRYGMLSPDLAAAQRLYTAMEKRM